MVARISKDGVTVSGSDMFYNYQQVLRQVVYTNYKPAYYLNRVFKLTCSELNGRFTSNEYVQTVSSASLKRVYRFSSLVLLTADSDSPPAERTHRCPCDNQ